MVGYMLYCKGIQEFLGALNLLRDQDIKYDVDYDKSCMFINQIEIQRLSEEVLTSLVNPRKRFFRELNASVDKNTGEITYGGQRTTTGSRGIIKKIQNSGSVYVYDGLTYYPRRKSVWISGLGYHKLIELEDMINQKHQNIPKETKKAYDILKKLTTWN